MRLVEVGEDAVVEDQVDGGVGKIERRKLPVVEEPRVGDVLPGPRDGSTKPPTAELGSMRELAGGAPTGVAREAVAAVRAWMVHALFDPWVVHFALAVTEPTPASEARTFVARLVAGGLGQLLGEATRAAPDAPLALRLRGEV